MWQLILGFILGAIFYRSWSRPKTKPVKPGLNKGTFVSHEEDVELYYNTMSSNSQKVRACLGEAGVKHKVHHLKLPSSGGWETKSPEFLAINPAGTVPVLVHKGHPIYESHEQILYIEKHLLPEGVSLSPSDSQLNKDMKEIVDYTGMMMEKGISDNPEAFLRKRAGNLLGPMTFPLFCAGTVNQLSWLNILENLSMIPFVNDYKIIVMTAAFKIYGVEGLRKIPLLSKFIGIIRPALEHHLERLNQDLLKYPGSFLLGDQITLADIGWIPVLQRMEYTRWWVELAGKYPEVDKFWANLKLRDAVKNSKPDRETEESLIRLGRQIDEWKSTVPWFNKIYKG